MKFTAVLGSGGTVMTTTPSRGAIGGVYWAVPPWLWSGTWPAWAFAWVTPPAALAWPSGADRRAVMAQPAVLIRATTSRTTTSHGGRCMDMGPRWGARVDLDLEWNSPRPSRIPTRSRSTATVGRMVGGPTTRSRGDPRPMPTDHGPELEGLRKRLADAKEFL